MSRSKHTDPKIMHASRRVRAPREGRGVGDRGRRRALRRKGKEAGVDARESQGRASHSVRAVGKNQQAPSASRGAQGTDAPSQRGQSKLRIIVQQPRVGFNHPADKQDVLELLKAVGPVAFYGLRSIELARSPANGSTSAPVFGRYSVPGRIILFE